MCLISRNYELQKLHVTITLKTRSERLSNRRRFRRISNDRIFRGNIQDIPYPGRFYGSLFFYDIYGGENPISFLSTYMEDLLRYKSQVVGSSCEDKNILL